VADGVIFVTRLTKRTRRKVHESLGTLDRAGANVVGLVINGLEAGGEYSRSVETGYYGGGYYGGKYGMAAYRYRSPGGAYYSDEKSKPSRREKATVAEAANKAPESAVTHVNGHHGAV